MVGPDPFHHENSGKIDNIARLIKVISSAFCLQAMHESTYTVEGEMVGMEEDDES